MSSKMNPYVLQNFNRIDFKPEDFDRTIFQKGARIVWEKAILCSCISEDTGQPDFTCPACYGKGFQYFDAKLIRAVVSGMNGDPSNMPIGLLDVGTAMLTTMSEDLVNFRDRLTFLDFRTVYSEILKYEGEPVKMKFEVEEIMYVKVLSTEISPVDYYLSEDKQSIIFSEGVLGYGERFSILVKVQPSYIVIDMPHELRGTFVQFGKPEEEWIVLPKQLMIKREDLLPLKRGEVL